MYIKFIKIVEMISNSLVISMFLKGLPFEYRLFTTVIIQKNKIVTFSEFKIALRIFKDSGKMIEENNSENTVTALRMQRPRTKPQTNNVPTCFTYSKPGCKCFDCQSKNQNYSVNNPPSKQYNSNSPSKNIICHVCHKPGHKNTKC